jgi:signal recognition particle receptor subunit beta
MWDDLVKGAIGAVVLVDTRRVADSFAAVDYFEASGIPFVVGVNGFDGVYSHGVEDIRDALTIGPQVPIVTCDARSRESTKATLITLIQHALSLQIQGLPVNR